MKQPNTLNGQEIELFRVGNYGDKGTYTDADAQDLVQRYSAGTHDEAAITAGHPERDSEPAYGWIKSLRFSAPILFGTPGEVNPDFDRAVTVDKAYKHRSVGLGRDRAGKLILRHVAFLGAVPPAIKGLRPATFSSDPYQEFAFSEGDPTMPENEELKKSIGDGIRAYFSELFGKKTEPTAIDEAALTTRLTTALETKFSEQLAAEKAAREELQTKFDAQQATFSSSTVAGRVATAIAGLKTANAWLPAYEKVGVPELFSEMASSDKTITFSEVDPADKTKTVKVERDLLTAFSDVLKSIGEIVPKGRTVEATSTATSKAAPEANGATVDPDSVAFSDLVQKFSEENKVPFTEAYRTLVSQGKKPTPGSSSAGTV